MATTLFLRSTAAQISRGSNSNNKAGSAQFWRAKTLSTTSGASAVFYSRSTVAGATNGIEALDGTLALEWISLPLAAGVTISGTISGVIWSCESNMNANCRTAVEVYKLAGVDYALTSIGSALSSRTETTGDDFPATNDDAFSFTPSSTAFAKGDRILVRVYWDDAGTMASGHNVWCGVDGPFVSALASDDNCSAIVLTENVTFASDPSTQQIFPVNTASDVATADVDYKAWTSRGT